MRWLQVLIKNVQRILLAVAIIAALNFIGLELYSLLTGREALANLWTVFFLEGLAMLILGVFGALPAEEIVETQQGTIAVALLGAEQTLEELKRKHHRKLNAWIQLAIIGLILLITGLLLFSSS